MSDENRTSPGPLKKVLIAAVLIAICVGCAIGYMLYQSRPADGTIEISFRINDPSHFPDDEPLSIPQTVVWLENSRGEYIQSLMVSDWTSSEGWEETVKLPDGTKVKKICPKWQVASGWPENHSKQVIDAVTRATPETGAHTVSVKCRDLKLSVGTYRCYVQTSVAPLHTILAAGTINIGRGSTETTADITYNPGKHKDAGPVLSDVKVRYAP
ncbi:MAG: DUF2271 domain-containing protein [Phycisphaerae bacterium]|jgi:hypothetical protein|nr:DUF2271 domain-containing protein [Phycisphaerae bacterium]